MKKIQNLDELKSLDKADLINEMLVGTIKGGSSCGATSNTGRLRQFDNDAV